MSEQAKGCRMIAFEKMDSDLLQTDYPNAQHETSSNDMRHFQMTWHNRPCHKLLMYVNIYSSVFLSKMFKILNLHKQITNNISFFTYILTNSKSFNLFKPFYVIQTRFAWFESMIKCTWFDIKFFFHSKFT